MVINKHMHKIVIALMSLGVTACILAMVFSDSLAEALGGKGVSMEYEEKLFNTDEVLSVDIRMDEDEWEEMLENALSEEYYVCDVSVNGKVFENVAIRPKGNTSLSNIAADPDTDRYSFKIEFDHFDDGQTCYGLDKLILNNNYGDATNMKEALVYDMYEFLGADASLYNYASVSVNGEYIGLYLALEAVEESFMLRNYGTQEGELYKPDNMEMGERNFDGENMPEGFPGGEMPEGMMPGGFSEGEMPEGMMPGGFSEGEMPEGMMPGGFPQGGMPGNRPGRNMTEGEDSAGDIPETGMPDGFPQGGMPGGGMFGGGMFGGGANLNYTDDELESYSSIWDGAVTDSGDSDHERVIEALRNIGEGNDLEKYLDVDNILKYMAVHAFAVNMDSLSGNMAHNYYLYEYDGRLNLIPWDYNLAFGGMGASDAGDIVNDAIDTPFDGTDFFDSLLENEEYLAKYHEYLRKLADEYVEGGRLDEVYSGIRSRIDALAESDPTAFFSYDEYKAAADALYEVIRLRAQSVAGQLDGSIASTDEGQKADPSGLIDASHIDPQLMGTMDSGRGTGFRKFWSEVANF